MPRKNTNLVDIEVNTEDPRMSQQACQAVVDCYKEIREEKENAIINEAINKRCDRKSTTLFHVDLNTTHSKIKTTNPAKNQKFHANRQLAPSGLTNCPTQ